MADLSKITLPSGTTYNFKDAKAREDIAAIEGAISGGVTFMGETTTPLTDGATTAVVVINGNNVTALKGYLVVYQSKEFVFDGSKWIEMGDLSILGALAYKDNASTDYTPAGTIELSTTNKTAAVSTATGTNTYTPSGTIGAPAISVSAAGSTTSVTPIASVGTLPSFTATVSSETLTLGWDAGTLPSKGSDVTVKTGDATYQAAAPTFYGTGVRLVTDNIAVPSSATFTGTQTTITVS